MAESDQLSDHWPAAEEDEPSTHHDPWAETPNIAHAVFAHAKLLFQGVQFAASTHCLVMIALTVCFRPPTIKRLVILSDNLLQLGTRVYQPNQTGLTASSPAASTLFWLESLPRPLRRLPS